MDANAEEALPYHRYRDRLIYTWTSNVLIAVNPFLDLDLYSPSFLASLSQLSLRELPPHCYSVAEIACRRLLRQRCSQSVIVSGESGAGKTTNMNHVMNYLAKRSSSTADAAIGSDFGQLLMQSNPVLEAFGNAATVRNRNSSRFGKFVKAMFDASGTRLSGMQLQTYLLEKVRVARPGPGERTFHVFYQLLAGAASEKKTDWRLPPVLDDEWLAGGFSGSSATTADAESPRGSPRGNPLDATALSKSFSALQLSMEVLSIHEEQQDAIFTLLAGILHLRRVHFVPLGDAHEQGCKPTNAEPLQHAVKQLGCPGLGLSLVQRVLHSGRADPICVPMGVGEATAARDALCKAIFSAIFDLIVARFNETAHKLSETHRIGFGMPARGKTMARRKASGKDDNDDDVASRPDTTARETNDANDLFIGLLDMFGFECFDMNGFEQLCINLANERLQQFFLRCVFKAEEEVHRLEGVPWPKEMSYQDNQGCIDLVGTQVLIMLDECSDLKGATESNFFERVANSCARDGFFSAAHHLRFRDAEAFVIRHFAGDVCYMSGLVQAVDSGVAPAPQADCLQSTAMVATAEAGVDTWLVKNRDRLLPELEQEMRESSSLLLSSLFKASSGRTKLKASARAKGTVARRFGADLDRLLDDLASTKASFIRCVKPNDANRAVATGGCFNQKLALSQLRCLGMTDLVRLMHATYPTRIPYSILHGRYATGMPPILKDLEPRAFCEAVARLCEVAPSDMYLGSTRLFLRAGKGMPLCWSNVP